VAIELREGKILIRLATYSELIVGNKSRWIGFEVGLTWGGNLVVYRLLMWEDFAKLWVILQPDLVGFFYLVSLLSFLDERMVSKQVLKLIQDDWVGTLTSEDFRIYIHVWIDSICEKVFIFEHSCSKFIFVLSSFRDFAQTAYSAVLQIGNYDGLQLFICWEVVIICDVVGSHVIPSKDNDDDDTIA
jgi:hypothetical protein